MILKSLELQGFKTFPDKTTLTFEWGITSVVGPNGSGKSNISDAMRWVLGEQSLRTLRCSKMEDVIFGGTPQRKALGFAEVTLTIDNSDRRLDFDNDTVAITRRYYRSGESEYLINKATVRLKDINELFMDTGLGRDGYSIIGQGKIDAIVAARSEDRREIFEEAAGISRYRYRKEESERRLNKAEENLVRLRDILSELEDRVEPLRVQAEKAEQFIAYDQEKKGLEIGIWLETLERSAKVLREHGEKLDLAQAQRREIEEELQQLEAQIEENYRETNRCTAQMEEARSRAAAFDEQAVRAEGEVGLLQNDLAHNAQDQARLEEQAAAALRSGEDTDREIAQKQEEIAAKEQQLAESRDRLLSFSQRLEELRKGADEATRRLEEAAAARAELGAALAEERIQLTSAQSTMAEIRLRAGAVDGSVAQAQERQAAARAEGEELAQMLQDTQTAIAGLENAVKGHELRLESRQKRAQAAKEQLDQLTLDAREQQRRSRLLEDLERNLEGFAQSVKAVMKEAGRGILQGVCGPVTQLLKTPKEYAVALETALGGAMQNIVVETEQDAKAAIRLLQQRDLGRATFLPLTTIRGAVLDQREMEDLPGFVGIASRLCQCEEKYAGIRDSLLGRVAVAEDLDSAVTIAKRMKYRFRIVSLDGQVVNAGGSLTGGSKAKNSGLLSRASEIQRVREKAAGLEQKAAQAAALYKERQEELAACTAELDAAKGELSALQEERIKVQAEAARAARELENASKELENLERERSDSQGRLSEMEALQAQSQEKIAALEQQLSQAQAQSQALTGDREEQLARCEDIAQTIQEIRLHQFSAEKDRDALAAAVQDLEARKRDSGQAAQRFAQEGAALEARAQELQAGIAQCQEQVKSLRAQAAAQRAGVEETAQKRTALERQAGEPPQPGAGGHRAPGERRPGGGPPPGAGGEPAEGVRPDHLQAVGGVRAHPPGGGGAGPAHRGSARRPAPPLRAEKQDQGPGRRQRGGRGGVPGGLPAVPIPQGPGGGRGEVQKGAFGPDRRPDPSYAGAVHPALRPGEPELRLHLPGAVRRRRGGAHLYRRQRRAAQRHRDQGPAPGEDRHPHRVPLRRGEGPGGHLHLLRHHAGQPPALLRAGRDRGRPGRRERHPLRPVPAADERGHPIHHHHPPPGHHGGQRHALRRHHAGPGRLQAPGPAHRRGRRIRHMTYSEEEKLWAFLIRSGKD